MTTQAGRLRSPDTRPRGDGRPVLLATFFSVPFDHGAAEFAVTSALEEGQPLIVANVVELPPLPMSVRLGYDQLGDPPAIQPPLPRPGRACPFPRRARGAAARAKPAPCHRAPAADGGAPSWAARARIGPGAAQPALPPACLAGRA